MSSGDLDITHTGGQCWNVALTVVVSPPSDHLPVASQSETVPAGGNGSVVCPWRQPRDIALPHAGVAPTHDLPIRAQRESVPTTRGDSSVSLPRRQRWHIGKSMRVVTPCTNRTIGNQSHGNKTCRAQANICKTGTQCGHIEVAITVTPPCGYGPIRAKSEGHFESRHHLHPRKPSGQYRWRHSHSPPVHKTAIAQQGNAGSGDTGSNMPEPRPYHGHTSTAESRTLNNDSSIGKQNPSGSALRPSSPDIHNSRGNRFRIEHVGSPTTHRTLGQQRRDEPEGDQPEPNPGANQRNQCVL